MKVWKLAASILVLGTIVISPKANAQNLLTPQQLSPLQNSISPSYQNLDTYFIQGFQQIESGDFRGAIADLANVCVLVLSLNISNSCSLKIALYFKEVGDLNLSLYIKIQFKYI